MKSLRASHIAVTFFFLVFCLPVFSMDKDPYQERFQLLTQYKKFTSEEGADTPTLDVGILDRKTVRKKTEKPFSKRTGLVIKRIIEESRAIEEAKKNLTLESEEMGFVGEKLLQLQFRRSSKNEKRFIPKVAAYQELPSPEFSDDE